MLVNESGESRCSQDPHMGSEAAAKIDAANSMTGTISGTTTTSEQKPATAQSA
jgi:hypothetical protein